MKFDTPKKAKILFESFVRENVPRAARHGSWILPEQLLNPSFGLSFCKGRDLDWQGSLADPLMNIFQQRAGGRQQKIFKI